MEEHTPSEPGGGDPGEEVLGEEPDDAHAAVCRGRASLTAWRNMVGKAQDVTVRNLAFVEVLSGRAVLTTTSYYAQH